jgi:hypothetical protein
MRTRALAATGPVQSPPDRVLNRFGDSAQTGRKNRSLWPRQPKLMLPKNG